MVSLLEQYRNFKAGKGRKVTAQQTAVIEAAFTVKGVFASEDVLSYLQGRVSRATAVRTLKNLVDLDLLRVVPFHGKDVFVATAQPPGHPD